MRFRARFSFLLIVLIAGVVLSLPAAAQTRILGVLSGGDYFSHDPEEGIYEIFPDTQTVNKIDGFGVLRFDLAANVRNDGYFFLDDSRGNTILFKSGAPGQSYDISAGTLAIGEGRDGFVWALDSNAKVYRHDFRRKRTVFIGAGADNLNDIACDVDGRLLAVTTNSKLVEISRKDASQTLVAILSRSLVALAVSHDGRLWGVPLFSTKLYEIDRFTGATTYVMDLPFAPNAWFSRWGLGSEPGPTQPVDTILLTGPASANVGDTITLDWSNAPADSDFGVLGSTIATSGSFQFGQPFEIGPGWMVLSLGTTSPTGTGSLQGRIPLIASGRTLFFEVGVREELSPDPSRTWDSNLLAVTIN